MAKASNFEFWDVDVKREDGPQFDPGNDGMSLGMVFGSLPSL